jgi:type IV secretory pathway VirB3-like protein
MRPGLFLAISILLLALWIGSIVMLHVASLMVHLLLLLAVLFLVGHILEATATEDFKRF